LSLPQNKEYISKIIMGGGPSKLADTGRKTILKASAIVKSTSSTNNASAAAPRKLPRSETERAKFISQPTPEQWRNAMEPTTTTATKSIDALHKKNAELVSNMHKIMNSDSGRITESVINTVGKRREKLVNENGRMKPEEIYGLVKAVSSMKKIKDGDIDAIAKEHGNLVDKMDAKTVKEFLAAPRLEKVMMSERQKMRTIGTWPS
jgi:hypothetical protein